MMAVYPSFRTGEIREQIPNSFPRTQSNLLFSSRTEVSFNAHEIFVAKMDHEKPEVVMPQIYEYASENTRPTLSPDFDFALEPSVEEPPNVEDRRERRGESLW